MMTEKQACLLWNRIVWLERANHELEYFVSPESIKLVNKKNSDKVAAFLEEWAQAMKGGVSMTGLQNLEEQGIKIQ